MKLKSEFKITKWDEKSYQDISKEQKLSKVSVEFTFTGDLTGSANTEWVMFYSDTGGDDPAKCLANYVGYIRVEGKANGKAGSFVLEDRGTYEGGLAKSVLTVQANSGTDGFKGIKGTGRYQADHTASSFELDCSFS